MKKCFKMSGKYKTEYLFVPVFSVLPVLFAVCATAFMVTVSAIVETNR